MNLTVKEIRAAREFSKQLDSESMPSEEAIDVLLEEIDYLRRALRQFAIGYVQGSRYEYNCYLCQTFWHDDYHEHHRPRCLLGDDR